MNRRSLWDEPPLQERLSRRRGRYSYTSSLRWCGTALLIALAVFMSPSVNAQTRETASRLGDLQIGGGFVFARSDYNFTPIHLIGGAAYTTFDWRTHYGAEFDFRHNKSSDDPTVYERTYEIGPRAYLTRGAFQPYGKVLFGRGVYNFRNSIANVAYNMYTFGGGADIHVRRSLNVRADYEYQNWMSFPLGTLHPSVITVGVAYHFHQ